MDKLQSPRHKMKIDCCRN